MTASVHYEYIKQCAIIGESWILFHIWRRVLLAVLHVNFLNMQKSYSACYTDRCRWEGCILLILLCIHHLNWANIITTQKLFVCIRVLTRVARIITAVYVETCNLPCTDLLMNSDRRTKTRSAWPGLLGLYVIIETRLHDHCCDSWRSAVTRSVQLQLARFLSSVDGNWITGE